MDAILYTTNTGSTEQYAKLLAQKTGLPACSLAEAKKRGFAGAKVVYLGWIMADSVKGYAEAAKRYRVCAVCGVGMGQTGTQTESVRKKSAIPANIPLFTLQGNFDVKIDVKNSIFFDVKIRDTSHRKYHRYFAGTYPAKKSYKRRLSSCCLARAPYTFVGPFRAL